MEYLELQGVVTNGATISDVEHKNARVYFRIDGYLFQTYGNYVHHEKCPIFNHPVSDYMAKKHNTPEGIAEAEKHSKEWAERYDKFDKHRATMYKMVFLRAFEKLKEKGEEEFMKFIDFHFDISENENNCEKLIQVIEKHSK